MVKLKVLNVVFALLIISSLLFGGSVPADAKSRSMKPEPETNGKMDQMMAMQNQPGRDSHGHPGGQMRSTTAAERKAARLTQASPSVGVSGTFAGIDPATAALSPLAPAAALATMGVPFGQPDYYGVANWANSPLPQLDPTGAVIAGTGIRKFVDTLAPLCALGANDLGQCIPLAVPDTTRFPGSDYYEISLMQYSEKMHADLPATMLRGYVQTNGPLGLAQPLHYLGPIIIAQGCEPHSTAGGNCVPRPVRIKFTNSLPTGVQGNLTIPTDTTYMGAGAGPQGVIARINILNGGSGYGTAPAVAIAAPPVGGVQAAAIATISGGVVTGIIITNEGAGYLAGTHPLVTIAPPTTGVGATATSDVPLAGENYTQNRATLHLHGGNTPWISDGTPHQWVTPAGENSSYTKGLSQRNVPDMWFDGSGNLLASCQGSPICSVPGATNDPGPGSETFYWTNQQGGRLMFYHDHAYGITRLNVYVGEAAGYLLVDPNVEAQLRSATVPGTITDPGNPTNLAANDVTHLIPLVIQDKTFVPDNGAPGGQLAATDPTWPSPTNPLPGSAGWGKGSLWFPHVYSPNQNPADVSGANAYGRWDYGPWFWPPQNPATLVMQPYACTSSIYGPNNPVAFPPLLCPGIPNPSGAPEGFMDTPLVNGTAYPSLTVEPTAYRFQILSAGNDRTLNLGLYIAEKLTVAVLNGGSGYNPATPPAVTFTPNVGGAAATATVSTGQVTAILVTGVGSGYSSQPLVTIEPPACVLGPTCIPATATAIIDPIVGQVTDINVTNSGAGYLSIPAVVIDPPTGCTTGCLQASAAAQLTSAGTILNIVVTNPGGPWTTAPLVGIAGPGAATGIQATAMAAVNSEVKMVGAVPPMPSSSLPLCTIPTKTGGSMLALATLNAVSGDPINGTGLPVACWPTSWPTDGRDGGVPDPTTVGPPIIQIGTEGGLLPSPVVIPSTPINFEYNRRSVTVLNVFTHGLLLGPAERADVVIDFSRFAGKTLILYNDAPAPVPAFDPRNDYYTGDMDQTPTGGAPSTLPGYGPNTRTIMQIKVNAASVANTFKLSNLTAALPNIFATTQDRIIVPQPAFPAGNGGNPTPSYVRLSDYQLTYGTGGTLTSVTLTNGGTGYSVEPSVSFAGGGGVGATATTTLSPTALSGLALTGGGANYTDPVTVIISGGGGSGATATATVGPGPLSSITLNSGGTGFTSAPAVTLTGGGGTGAVAVATLTPTSLATVSLLPGGNGTGYSSAPTVVFSGGGGTGAVATAVLAPVSIAKLTLTNPGSGYTTAPTVSFSGGGGSLAAAVVTLPARPVGAITLTGGGAGYKKAPSVSITGGGGAGATAVATISGGVVVSIIITNGGTGYTSAPTIGFTGANTKAATATAVLAPAAIASLTLTNAGTGYTSAPTVVFTGGGGGGAAATAALNLTSVQSITLNNPGSGYIAAPAVGLVGGGGSGANATTSLTPTSIGTVTLTVAGSGYTSAPSVGFTGGGGAGAAATAILSGSSINGLTLVNPGTGYTSTPTVSFVDASGLGTGATAKATLVPSPVGSITLTSGGIGYVSPPTISFSGGGGTGAAAISTLGSAGATTKTLDPKAIQELFTLDYGRMNALLGVEIPRTNFQVQTTIPYGYVDPPTEIFKEGDVQIWKITHNGVDTHFIHFHLFNVQIINRIGWDGSIKPPDPNEVAWKDTVRMNPLEIIVVALRPLNQALPWDLPNSVRPLDVTQPVGSSMPNEFLNMDPTGVPAAVTNDLTNFGYEYVWHCHILGHEENDMMRTMVLGVPPAAPVITTAAGNSVTWMDNSLNETGFTVQAAATLNGPWNVLATLPGVPGKGTTLLYKNAKSIKPGMYVIVIANNLVGYTKIYPPPANGYAHPSFDSATPPRLVQ